MKQQMKNGERLSLYRATTDAGFSEKYAKSGKLQKTRTWQEILEQEFSDEKLAKKHDDLMQAETIRQVSVHYKLKDDEIAEVFESRGMKLIGTKRFMTTCIAFVSVPDHLAQDKALDKAYKIKKRYDNTINLKGAITQLSDEELEAEIASIFSEALDSIAGEK